MPFHALCGSWRLRPFFCATRENAAFQRGVCDKTYRAKHALSDGPCQMRPAVIGRLTLQTFSERMECRMNGEGCLTCLTPDPACAAYRRGSWSDGRGRSLASAPRVAAGIGESSLYVVYDLLY